MVVDKNKFKQYDTDTNGILSEEELKVAQYVTELELKEEKSEAQKKMAWTSIATMVVFTAMLFSSFISTERVDALSDILGIFYITQAGIVGAYMGVTAWMSKK